MQSKQRLLQLNAKLADMLTSKGVTATADETTTSLINKVADITSGDDTALISLIQRDMTEFVIPNSVTSIGDYAFSYCTRLTSVIIPNSVTSIGKAAFQNCSSLTSITIPDSVTSIKPLAFYSVYKIESDFVVKPSMTVQSLPNSFLGGKLIFEEGITALPSSDYFNYGGCIFKENAYIYLSSTITSAGCYNVSNNMSGLRSNDETCTLEVGNGFDVAINASKFIQTAEKWVKVFEALADRTGQTALVLTIGPKNVEKLTDEQIAIATNKNWTLA